MTTTNNALNWIYVDELSQEIDAERVIYVDPYGKESVIFESGKMDPLFFTNFIQCSNYFPSYQPGRAKLLTEYVDATLTKPGVVSGCTFTSWRDGSDISWPTALLSLLSNQGTIDFDYKPNFSGNPQEDILLFKISDPDITITYTTAGEIEIDFGGLKTLTHSFTFPESKTIISLAWQFDDDPNNVLELYLDRELVASDSGFADINRGDTTNSYISNYIRCNSFDEGGKGGPLYIFAGLQRMTLNGVPMTLEGEPMYLGA